MLQTTLHALSTNDATSAGILAVGADELAAPIETTRVLIGFGDDEPVPVSYSGGMFSDDGFLALFRAALGRLPAKFDLHTPLLDPALGAAIYAAKHSGHPLTRDALHQLGTPRT